MAHCSAEDLKDLEFILNSIRLLEKIKEKGFSKFYLKSKAFLHFHKIGTRRWADVRDGLTWGSELELSFNASEAEKNKFLVEVNKRYFRTLNC